MLVDGSSLKSFLESRRQAIEDAHRRGAGGFDTCAALTAVMDESIAAVVGALPGGARDRIAVLALGGYGRAELFPYSDIDIMVLCSSGEERGAATEDAKAFLHMLWDAGVDVGHSVRTIEEVLELQGNVLDAWTSVLESRFLCGSERLFDDLTQRLRSVVSAGHDPWLLEGVFADARSRHERYGNSVKLLEPNVKKSAGGLRDLHNLFWLYRGTDPVFFQPIRANDPATKSFLEVLVKTGALDDEGYTSSVHALQFLFRVRHELHFLQGSLHDTLEYALQRHVAHGLGYESLAAAPDGGRGVERFMHDYYLHARNLFRLHQQLSHHFREVIESGRRASSAAESIGSGFLLYEDVLSIDPGVRRFDDPRTIFDAFAIAAENEVDLDFRLRAVIERSGDLMGEADRTGPPLSVSFQRILRSRRVAPTLHAMNDLGILGRYIPEFGDLVAFFQHNVYHYFTADEHTLIAIAKAEALRDEQGVLHEVFRNLREKNLLYLALLLHDIGKPHGVSDHEISGIEIARKVLHRLNLDDRFPDISFLVRNHLLMEQVAFRRNVHDPETIKEFSARFQHPEQLDYLYVLTYADLSAVNTGVWTAWKAAMLQELYQHASEVLRRNLRGEQIDVFHQARHEAATDRVVEALSGEMPREEIERHLRGMQSDAYVALFTEEEIGQHIVKSSLHESVSTIFSHFEGYTEVTVIAQDAPFALSKFCAVLSANDANIFDANIFTRDDGIIIDRFRVTAAAGRRQLDERVCTKISDDLRSVVDGTQDIEHLFAEHKRRWKRRPRAPMNPNIRTDVEFEDNPRYTILDVYAPDAVGFLYRATETMSRLGLDIYFAKIATRGDGIVDAFYVLDRDGKQLKDPFRREAIRNEILMTIQAMAEEELG
jgi:[protein-PII] uridylyltransferase